MGLGEVYLDSLPQKWCETCRTTRPRWRKTGACVFCNPLMPDGEGKAGTAADGGYYSHLTAMAPKQESSQKEPGHPEFLKLLDQMRELHQRKAADYGTRGDDPLANLRASEAFGIPAWVGAVMRCNDKMKRIQSFVKNGELKNESVEDSLLDGAAYFLLALVLYREGKAGAA